MLREKRKINRVTAFCKLIISNKYSQFMKVIEFGVGIWDHVLEQNLMFLILYIY